MFALFTWNTGETFSMVNLLKITPVVELVNKKLASFNPETDGEMNSKRLEEPLPRAITFLLVFKGKTPFGKST